MARRPRPNLADYAVIGISPALIMFLIGSLVFFLIAVFYQGQYDTRLSFIMAMFIMAAVCVARISIEDGREYAALFALPLAGVTLFAMFRFVEFSGALARLSWVLNIGLVAMIWFCADKLTWDCTVIDESQDLSGQGLLQTAGLGDEEPAEEAEAASEDPGTGLAPVASGLWRKFVEHRRRPHAPGIWVIYFSIAALPIFGFGQPFLRDDLSRRYAFKLLVVYVGAALGLLLTTSFLGLRRYLRQRRLEMPVEMAGTWLGVGAAMIVALLLVCMLMPRRNAEYSVSDLAFLNSPIDLPVSDWAVGNDGQQQDQADRTQQQDDAEQQMEGRKGEGGQTESKQSQSGNQAKNSPDKSGGQKSGGQKSGGQKSGKQSKRDDGGQGKKSDQQSPGKSQERDSNHPRQGEPPGGEKGDQNNSKQDEDAAKRDGRDDQQPQDQASSYDPERKSRDPSDPSDQQHQDDQARQQQSETPSQSNQSQANPSKSSQSRSNPSQSKQSRQRNSTSSPRSRVSPSRLFSNLVPSLGGILKALYWLIAAALIGYLVWKHWEKVRRAVENFIKAMRDFWARLFGGRSGEDDAEDAEAAEPAPRWRPFSDYSDPFVSGRADRSSMDELIGYTFEAFEAWGREQGCGRLAEQTPLEFAKAAIQCHGGLGKDALRVAELYNWTAFGKTAVPDTNRESLRRFWQELSACAVV